MKLTTKRAIELSNKDLYTIEELERKYKIEIIIKESPRRRVDKYEVLRSHIEIHRSECFKDVKIDIRKVVRARYMYYRDLVGLSFAETVNILANSEFLRGVDTIKHYLGDCPNIEADLIASAPQRMPLFVWSGKFLPRNIEQYATRKARQIERERVIASYYYFYGECLSYNDTDREYVICYRDFHITPNQLQRIVAENYGHIEELRAKEATPDMLRKMYPAFAWDCSISFNDCWGDMCECDSVRNTLDVYLLTKKY